jgi:hypothetical protein
MLLPPSKKLQNLWIRVFEDSFPMTQVVRKRMTIHGIEYVVKAAKKLNHPKSDCSFRTYNE